MKQMLLALLLLFGVAHASEKIRVFTDGTPVQFFDAEPTMVRGRVMVPMRAVFEALGAEISWNGATQSASAWKDERSIALRINSTQAFVNGVEVTLDVPPMTINDRVMVPLRFVGEAFGASVRWEPETRTVLIQTVPPPP